MEIIKALLSPEAYDEKVKKIKMLQTHISFVFLTGNFVYKVKKPVNLGFLDFTTLEKRKFYCEEELRVNKPLCGDIYMEVVPISFKDGKIKVKGEGEIVEYAVKIRQLPQSAIMTKLLKKNEISKKDIAKIAELLAGFHSKANSGEGINEYGSVKQITANWVQNFNQTRNLRGSLIGAEEFDFIENKVLNFIQENTALFEERIKSGKIRECHGDVHSGNIFIIKTGNIYIFDAVEFNKAFSCSDVAAEVAFLSMDLTFHEKSKLAEYFIEKYVEYSRDKELLKLLRFYECYRAYVRAKVASFKLGDPNIAEKEKMEAEDLTKRYFALALNYAKNFFI